MYNRFTPPPPGFGDWRLLTAPDPWVCCLNVVADLSYHVKAQQKAVDGHQAAAGLVQDAFNSILNSWEREVERLEAQRILADSVADTIQDAHCALEDADSLCAVEEKRLKFLQANLLHYTRRLRELGLQQG